MSDAERVDAVIVGARCAGSAAATALAKAGRKVVVLDKARFPSDTLSTHVMVPSGVAELQRMGALDAVLRLDPARCTHMVLEDGDVSIRERFRPFDGCDYVLSVPRDQLDGCLVQAARAHGADVREASTVDRVLWREGRAAGVVYRDERGAERVLHAPLIVGADGRRSRIAAEVGAWTPYRGSDNGRGFAFRYVDDPRIGTPQRHEIAVHRAGRTSSVTAGGPDGRMIVVWLCPAEDIAAFRRDPEAAWRAKLDADPDGTAARVAGATNPSKVRSATGLHPYYRASTGPGWALAGDAGHFKDPTAGSGMRDALHHGRLLGEQAARALDDGPAALDDALTRWERHRDRDTISSYHWGNQDSWITPTTDLVRETLRTFAGHDGPDLSDTFNRGRPVERVIGPSHLVRGLVNTLRKPGVDRRAVLREARAELPRELQTRRHRHLDGFRSTRPVVTETPGWTVGPPPSPRVRPPAAGARSPGSGP